MQEQQGLHNIEHISELVNKGLLSYTLSKAGIWLLFILSIIQHILTVMAPFFLIFVISKLWFIDNINTYIGFAIGFFLLGALWITLAIGKEQVFFKTLNKYNNIFSNESLSLLLSLPYNYIGNLPVESQFIRFIPLDNFSQQWIYNIIKPLLDLPLVLLAFIVISYLLGFTYFACVMFVLIIVISLVLYKNNITNSKIDSISEAKAQGDLFDTINNLDLISKYKRQEYFYNQNNKLYTEKTTEKYIKKTKAELISNLYETILLVIYVLSLFFAIFKTLSGELATQYLIIILLLTWFSIAPFKTILNAIDEIYKIKNVIFQFKTLSNINLNKNRHKKIIFENSNIINNITANNIVHKYSNNNYLALNNISFSTNKNNIVFIHGISGSGKTTLLKIISGLMEPASGKVIINNSFSLDMITSNSIRNIIIYIPANTININNKLKALLKTVKNKIIILDEPLINSTQSEYENILNNINKLKQNNTIIIASRLGFYAEISEQIIILNNGNIEKLVNQNK